MRLRAHRGRRGGGYLSQVVASIAEAPSAKRSGLLRSGPYNYFGHPGVDIEALIPTASSDACEVLRTKPVFGTDERNLVEAFDTVVLAQLGIAVA